MTNNKQEEWEKEFDKEFPDMTHTGCPDKSLPCATMKKDVKDFIRQTLETNNEKLREELVKPSEIRTAKSACKEEDNFDFGYDIKTKEISDLLQSNLNKENI